MITTFKISTFHLAIFFGILFICASCTKKDSEPTTVTNVGTTIEFTGVSQAGIFDPSVSVATGSSRIWMSFSSVDQSPTWPANTRAISTHIGHSDDSGVTWQYDQKISSFTDVTIGLAAPNNAGTWDHEVSNIIFDQNALAAEQWKIFWHHYLQINGSRKFEHGWIAYKAASSPALLASATEHKLFVGTTYDTSNNATGGASQSPLGGAPEVNFTALHSDLADCAVLTEPGVLSLASGLYLTLHCAVVTGTPDNRIVLLKYTHNTTTWSYLGTLLRNSDATALGFDSGFSATGLFSKGGVDYLVVTPVKTTPFAGYYDGCYVFPFSDITTASLVKSGGVPTASLYLQGTATRFNGACAHHANLSGSGILFSELDLSGAAAVFRIKGSGKNL